MLTETFEGIKVAVFYVNDFFVEVAYDIKTMNVLDIIASVNLKDADELLKGVELNFTKK